VATIQYAAQTKRRSIFENLLRDLEQNRFVVGAYRSRLPFRLWSFFGREAFQSSVSLGCVEPKPKHVEHLEQHAWREVSRTTLNVAQNRRRVSPRVGINVLDRGLSSAGFEVTAYGRFWVTAEVSRSRELTTRS
jgi:hypothetical protein